MDIPWRRVAARRGNSIETGARLRYNGLAQNPNDAAADRYLKICHRSIARCGQHIAGVIQSAASQKMFMYTVGNASDGGAEFLARGVHVSKARSVGPGRRRNLDLGGVALVPTLQKRTRMRAI